MVDDKVLLKKAIDNVCNVLGITIDHTLMRRYQEGYLPNLLNYDKLNPIHKDIPVIQKYLIGAHTYLDFPTTYYDIFRICRCFFIVQILSHSLDIIISKACNFEKRLDLLIKEKNFDAFDSLLYELVVAARYASSSKVANVTFLDSKSSSHPDFIFEYKRKNVAVECKKFNRIRDFSIDLRNTVAQLFSEIMNVFLQRRWSALFEISFCKQPGNYYKEAIKLMSIEAYHTGSAIIDRDITVLSYKLYKQCHDTYVLFPSPKYLKERYNFYTGSGWWGIVHQLGGIPVCFERKTPVPCWDIYNQNKFYTWWDEIDYECAIKWKVTDSNVINCMKKISFSRIFEGLSQLQTFSKFGILHIWIERDPNIGHRKKELLSFYEKLIKSSTKHNSYCSWIIFNETIFDVTIDGTFDLIEHAHSIKGPSILSPNPLVEQIFIPKSFTQKTYKNGPFGIGYVFKE